MELLYGDKTVVIAGNSTIAADTWYHVAVTYDSSDAHLYINGVEDNYRNIIYPFPGWYNIFYIGNQCATGSPSNDFPGIIDELRISNAKRTATEISDYYNETK